MQHPRQVLIQSAFYGSINNAVQQICHKVNYRHNTRTHPWYGIAATNQIDRIGHPKTYAPQFCQIFRSIYSDEYMKIDSFRHKCVQKNLQLGNKNDLQTQLADSFSKNGIQNIFAQDLRNLIYLAETDCDLQQISDIIRAFVEDAYRLSANDKIEIISNFITQCKILKTVDIAKDIWNDKNVSIYKRKNMINKYYVILYDHGYYTEIIEDFERADIFKGDNSNCENATRPFKDRDTLVVFAALAKIGTENAFSKMTQLIKEEHIVFPRQLSLYSWLAVKLKKHGLANDAISKLKPGPLRTNIRLDNFIEAGRTKEAILMLRSEMRPACNNELNPHWYMLSSHVIKKLAEAVQEQNNSELTKDLVRICHDLDLYGKITESSLEDLVFKPVKFRPESTRQKKNYGKNVNLGND